MIHSYQDSKLNPNTCSICNHGLIDHTEQAVCESCYKQGPCEIAAGILSCEACFNYVQNANSTEMELHQRAIETKRAFQQIDANIKVSTDVFNAKTIAIHKIKTAIDEDPAITNKNFALAQLIEERFLHLKDIIFSRRQEVLEAENEQKAIQVYYNELAKRLRQEERECIRLKDVQYKPIEPIIKKPKAITVKKFDKDEINRIAADTGVSAVIIQVLCVAKGISPVEAARLYKETKSTVQ